jgi:glutamine synthetase
MQEAFSKLKQAGAEVVHVGIFDIFGTFRQRRFRLDKLEAAYDELGAFVNVLPNWDAGERVFGEGPFVGEPLSFDEGSVRRYPFEPNAAMLVCDYAGPSSALSPRRLLAQQIEAARAKGFEVRAGYEFEFYVLEEDGNSLREQGYANLRPFAVENRCWAGESAAIYSDFVAGLESTLADGDIDPLSLGLELGPGCFEATLAAGEPLRAADDAAFFKTFTKAYCRRQGLTASFMAQLGKGFAGLSGHLHLSLSSAESGQALFPGAEDSDGMSDVFRSFVAGMVRLAPEAMAMSHHTVNSYRRLSPGNWAPKSATWAPENYSAAVRVVSKPASRCRLEYRLPGSDTNPYLTLAFAIGAGIWGVEEGLRPPPAFMGGSPDEMPEGSAALPQSLGEAARRYAQSDTCRALFGDAFVDHFVRVLQAEDAAMKPEVGAPERARYIEVV